MKALRVAIRGILREYVSMKDLGRIVSDLGKRQSKKNQMSQENITIYNIQHSDFPVFIEAPNGSPQPMSTFYIERAFQRLLTHPIPSLNEGDMSITSWMKNMGC